MKKFFAFLKNRGFTLVEALVATIIAGYRMLPIMGTLQSGIERTQGFDHKEKLRLLARSRLNKELSVGAFDHTPSIQQRPITIFTTTAMQSRNY